MIGDLVCCVQQRCTGNRHKLTLYTLLLTVTFITRANCPTNSHEQK